MLFGDIFTKAIILAPLSILSSSQHNGKVNFFAIR